MSSAAAGFARACRSVEAARGSSWPCRPGSGLRPASSAHLTRRLSRRYDHRRRSDRATRGRGPAGDAWAFGMIFDHLPRADLSLHRQPRPSPVGRGGPDAARLRQGPGGAAAVRVAGRSLRGLALPAGQERGHRSSSGPATTTPSWTRWSERAHGDAGPDEIAIVRQELDAVGAALAKPDRRAARSRSRCGSSPGSRPARPPRRWASRKEPFADSSSGRSRHFAESSRSTVEPVATGREIRLSRQAGAANDG